MSTTAENRVRSTFKDLDAWRLRLSTPFQPAPGSELATDDSDWLPTPVSQIAVAAAGAARDHLQAVRVQIDARNLFPYAQMTLIRTAMLAAAQAVWVFAPAASSQRIERARTLAKQEYEQHLLFLTDLMALAPADKNTASVHQHVSQRLAQLDAKRAADGQRAKFEATRTVELAALATWGSTQTALEAKVEWRRGSGAAHGLLWSVLGQPGTQQTASSTTGGLATFTTGGTIEAMANPYMCAHGLLTHAFDLLDRRGT